MYVKMVEPADNMYCCISVNVLQDSMDRSVRIVSIGVFKFKTRLCVGCMCGVHVWLVCVGCMCGVHVWGACVGCMCGVHVWGACVGCICGVHAWGVCVGMQMRVHKEEIVSCSGKL